MEKHCFRDFSPLNNGKRFVVSFIGWRKEEIGFLRKKQARKLYSFTVHWWKKTSKSNNYNSATTAENNFTVHLRQTSQTCGTRGTKTRTTFHFGLDKLLSVKS